MLPLLDDATQLTGDAGQFLAQLQQRKHAAIALEAGKGLLQVKHYAGPVSYQAALMPAANLDVLAINAVRLCSSSGNALLAQWFASDAAAVPAAGGRPAAAAAVTGSPAARRKPSGYSSPARKASVAAKFRSALNGLMDELQRTECLFIRTIKPNAEKAARTFIAEPNVRAQLEQGGVVEGECVVCWQAALSVCSGESEAGRLRRARGARRLRGKCRGDVTTR